MFHIIDNIYLSNLIDASNHRLIRDNKIEAVFRLSEDINKTMYGPSVEFCNYEIEDNILYKKEIIEIAKDIVDKVLSNKERNVLIHCNEGQSRSVTVIIYYLITQHGFTFEEAYDLVKSKKKDIHPNDAFIKALRAL